LFSKLKTIRKGSCIIALFFPVLFGEREAFTAQRNCPFPLRVSRKYGPGWLSQYSDSLQAGRSVDRIPMVGGEIFLIRPDRSWGSPSRLYNGYRVFTGVKTARAWQLHSPYLAPRLKKSIDIPLLHLWAFMACRRANFTFVCRKCQPLCHRCCHLMTIQISGYQYFSLTLTADDTYLAEGPLTNFDSRRYLLGRMSPDKLWQQTILTWQNVPWQTLTADDTYLAECPLTNFDNRRYLLGRMSSDKLWQQTLLTWQNVPWQT
jgi:hypothetical protein